MLPRKFRLKEEWKIKKLLRHGRRIYMSQFVIHLGQNQVSHSRFAFLASRKVGNATKRNRALRILRESTRAVQNLFPAGYDYIVVAKPEVLQDKTQAVIKELEKACCKIGQTTREKRS